MRAAAALFAASLALPAAAQPFEASLRVVNRSPVAIVEVNASAASEQRWLHNRLGSEQIRPGGSQTVRLPPTSECLFDVRIVLADGRTDLRSGLDVCRAPEVVVTGAGARAPAPAAPAASVQGNPSFNLVNRTPLRVAQLFASPSDIAAWGPNHLGRDVVNPGGVHGVRLPAGTCRYDLRIVFENMAVREWRGMDLCQVTNLVLQ
jgi:hypothetical protein